MSDADRRRGPGARTASRFAVLVLGAALQPASGMQLPSGPPAGATSVLVAGWGTSEARLTPAQEPAAPRRQLLDGVAAVVGDEAVTHREIDAYRQLEARAGRTVEGGVILEERVRDLLKAQGGRNLVLDESLVNAQIEARWKESLELRGGAVQTSEFLAGAGVTPPRLREIWRLGLYAQVWEESITGEGIGPSGRPRVDRYIRPGQRMAFYRLLANSPSPAERAQVGARPERAVIQQLILATEEYGGVEEARTLGAELRQLAESDRSDFGDLVARYGATGTRESRGLGAPISLADLEQLSVTRHRSRALLDFATTSEPGSISEPMLGWKLGEDVGAIVVYKLLEHLPAEEPKKHTDLEVQKSLDKLLLDQFDKVRLEFALREAFAAAYIWTLGEGAQAAPATPEPGAEPGAETTPEGGDAQPGPGAEVAPEAGAPASDADGAPGPADEASSAD